MRGVDEPKRSTLQALLRTILEIVPEAEQGLSYRVPAFRVRGKVVAGFAAFGNHLMWMGLRHSLDNQWVLGFDGPASSLAAPFRPRT